MLHEGDETTLPRKKEEITVTQVAQSLQFFRAAQLGHLAVRKCPIATVDVTASPKG